MRLTALGPGSGFGPEIKPFHRNLFNSGIHVEAPLTITTKIYESFGFLARYPMATHKGTDEPWAFDIGANYESRPSENFFGLGNETNETTHTQFRSVNRTIAAGINRKLTRVWTLRAEAGYRNTGITEPRNFASTQSLASANLPGLRTGATMRSVGVVLQYDTRDREQFAGTGTLQRIEASVHEGVAAENFGYWRYHYNAQHYFALSQDGRTVIALRGELETNREKGGSAIPFFDLPAIGNPESLPGFETRRFVDKSVVDYTAEYRYRIWRYFDGGLFVSQGQVAPQIGDFGWSRFHTGYGMRFLVRPNSKGAVALDLGHSREGWTLYLNFSPSF
jgi:outer membrane protein assembly factor BamA